MSKTKCPVCGMEMKYHGETRTADDSDTKQAPDTNAIWKSYVWHNGKCFFVSTIFRNFVVCGVRTPGEETIVWEYDYEKRERGEMLYQAGGIHDHQQICRCLIVEGLLPKEEDENHNCAALAEIDKLRQINNVDRSGAF